MFEKIFFDFKKQFIFVLSSIVILLMILIVYWQDLYILINEAFYNEAVSHIFLVPVLFTYILYQKRSTIKATFAFDYLRNRSKSYFITEAIGLSFCLSALLIYWYGSYTFSPLEYHLLTLPLFLAGTILVFFNFKTLTAVLFPILILLLLIPIPSEITYVAGA